MKNNRVILSGNVVNQPEHLFTTKSGSKFYATKIKAERRSKIVDIIPVVFGEEYLQLFNDAYSKEQLVFVNGYYRSRNEEINGKHRLLLSVYVEHADIAEIIETEHINNIELTGFVVKTPSYRKTPKDRNICDLMIAVNRDDFKSDYIPCIVWGRLADAAKDYVVGTKVKLDGRIQSRIYNKVTDGKTEERVAYEVSVNKIIEVIDEIQ